MKKGFTLIELLSVIAILAIILLIAIPMILDIFSPARQATFKAEAQLILDNIESKLAENINFDPTTINESTITSLLGVDVTNIKTVSITNASGILSIDMVGQNEWNGLKVTGTSKNLLVQILDIVDPTISFSSNGNTTYAKTRTITVTVTDDKGIDENTLKYQWTTSTSEPTEGSFSNLFASGTNVTTPVGVTGSYYLWIIVKDNGGNTVIKGTNVFNLDNTIPVITMSGTTPVNITVGSSYTDAGATATDNIDGNLSVTVSSNLVPTVIGTYNITYSATDSSGNTNSLVRTVNVIDSTIPTVAFGTNGNVTYAKTRSTTLTVSDNVAVNASSLKYQWTTSTTAPTEASFSTSFTNGGTINTPSSVTGGYYLWILAKDTSGNTTITRSNIFNLDNTVPVITMNGSTPVTINIGGSYTDLGATATDTINGSLTVTVTSTVVTTTAGTYYVYYNVSDTSGNAAIQVTRTVIVKGMGVYFVDGGTDFNGALYHYSYNGSSWSGGQVGSDTLNSYVSAYNSSTAYSSSGGDDLNGVFYRYTYSGGWSSSQVGSNTLITKVSAADANTVFSVAGGDNSYGAFYKNTYSGSWSSSQVGSLTTVTRAEAVDANTVFAVDGGTDFNGVYYRYTYSGGWSSSQVGSNALITRVSPVDANTAFSVAGGDNGYGALYKDTYSSSWSSSQVGSLTTVTEASAVDANTVFAVDGGTDLNGALYRYTYSGGSWSSSQVGSNVLITKISAIDANTVFAVAGGDNGYGAIYVYTYNGSSWSSTQLGSLTTITEVSGY